VVTVARVAGPSGSLVLAAGGMVLAAVGLLIARVPRAAALG
jgi:hypothetical protein